ncbi:hypothetical protein BT69DRAFT_1290915, partial [Atractiella rhizophila]
MDSDDLSSKPFTCTFHLADNRSQAIFDRVARYSKEEQRFVPICEWEELTISSTGLGTTIQLSLSPTRTQGINSFTILKLPSEILFLVFEFLPSGKYEEPIEAVADKHKFVSFLRVSAVSQLWNAVSAPYLDDFVSVEGLQARLKAYLNAGRLRRSLHLGRGGY